MSVVLLTLLMTLEHFNGPLNATNVQIVCNHAIPLIVCVVYLYQSGYGFHRCPPRDGERLCVLAFMTILNVLTVLLNYLPNLSLCYHYRVSCLYQSPHSFKSGLPYTEGSMS